MAKATGKFVQPTGFQQLPGLGRRRCDDHLVVAAVVIAFGADQAPLFPDPLQFRNPYLRSHRNVFGQRPGNGGHPGYAYVAGFLGERLPLLILALKAETALPGAKIVGSGKRLQKRKKLRVTGREILGSDVRRASRNPFRRHTATGATTFLEDPDIMALSAKQNSCGKARKA